MPKECDSTTCLAGFQCYLVGSNTSSRFQRVYSLESLHLRHLPPYYIQQNEFLEVGSHKSRVYCGLLNTTNSSKHCDGATLVVPRSTVITRTCRWLAVQITVARESSHVDQLIMITQFNSSNCHALCATSTMIAAATGIASQTGQREQLWDRGICSSQRSLPIHQMHLGSRWRNLLVCREENCAVARD
jgi:hypothetical protein